MLFINYNCLRLKKYQLWRKFLSCFHNRATVQSIETFVTIRLRFMLFVSSFQIQRFQTIGTNEMFRVEALSRFRISSECRNAFAQNFLITWSAQTYARIRVIILCRRSKIRDSIIGFRRRHFGIEIVQGIALKISKKWFWISKIYPIFTWRRRSCGLGVKLCLSWDLKRKKQKQIT